MSDHNTGIEWTHVPGYRGETWNPLAAFDKETGERGWFCTHVSEGCRHCYAERMNVEQPFGMGTGHEYKHQNLDKIEFRLVNVDQPIRWTKPRAVFVNSMTDLFHEAVPFEMIDEMFAAMALSPEHVFMVLTKRPERMAEYLNGSTRRREVEKTARQLLGADDGKGGHDAAFANLMGMGDNPLPNVWLGTSCEDQETADERIPHLLECPAAVRFLSCEPLLGPIDLIKPHAETLDKENVDPEWWVQRIDWIIAGGESGPEARPMHPQWVRRLRDQCGAMGTPFFFKQWGAWLPFERRNGQYEAASGKTLTSEEVANNKHHIRGNVGAIRVGKKRAGRTLDGRTHDAFPDSKVPA